MKIKFNNPPSSPNEVNGLKVNYAPSKRPISKWRFRVVLLLFLLPFIVFGGYLIYRFIFNMFYVSAPGFLIFNQITIKAPYDGKIEFIKKPGEKVVKGEIIAKIRNYVLESNYQELLKDLKQIEPMVSIKTDEEILRSAREIYEYWLKTYEEILNLRKRGAATSAEVTKTLSQLNSAKMLYLQTKSSLQRKPIFISFISQKARLNELKSILESLTIRAPQTGVVVSVFAKEGELISKNRNLITIQNYSNIRIEAFLNPKKLKKIVLNKKARTILPDGQSIKSKIVALKPQTQLIPSALVSEFTKNKFSVVIELEPLADIPENFKINYLPIRVIF